MISVTIIEIHHNYYYQKRGKFSVIRMTSNCHLEKNMLKG